LAGQVTVPAVRSIVNWSLANPPVVLRHRWDLRHHLVPVAGQSLQGFAVGVGAVTHYRQRIGSAGRDLLLLLTAGVRCEELIDGVAVRDVPGRDRDSRDQLRHGVDRDVGLVPVEGPGLAVMPVPCLSVDRGDDPVLGDLAGDREDPVLTLHNVLPGDQREQLRLVGHHRPERLSFQQGQGGEGIEGIEGIEGNASTNASTRASLAARSSKSHAGLPTVA